MTGATFKARERDGQAKDSPSASSPSRRGRRAPSPHLLLQQTGTPPVSLRTKSSVQTKLAVSRPGDAFEQEADRVAERVMRMPDTTVRLQRKCACSETGEECQGCANKALNLQRSVNGSPESIEAPAAVHAALGTGGQPLSAPTRSFMESRFGHDFSHVRLHTDARAAESARAVGALAYTVGRDVVFGSGQYAPDTAAGKQLLAHELTHVVQQQGAPERVQRQADDEAGCPTRVPGELQTSHTSAGFLEPDVTIGPGRVHIADFGIDWRHIKPVTRSNALLATWLSTFESDDTYRLRIVGYSDCFGSGSINIHLRQGRALNVERLLGPRARSRVTFRGMAALGQFINPNDTVENRARNRAVVIEFQRNLQFDPEEVTVVPRRCGPESTQWLIDQMSRNRNHPVIKTSREVQWPNYVPFFNLGWNYGVLSDFRDLVRAGGPWDFKSNQRMWRARSGQTCPTQPCDRTAMLCGRCFNYDVPGNIHYGWIGRQAGLRAWFLHNRAAAAQAGGVDDPRDTVAINIGIAMADNGAALCDLIRQHGDELNLERTEGCGRCSTT